MSTIETPSKDTIIKAVEQVIIEGKYSRKNIREKVLADVTASAEDDLSELFQAACGYVNTYLSLPYKYESKTERVAHVNQLINDDRLTVEDIVTEIMLVVFQVEGIQTIQSACGRILHLFEMDDVFDGVKTAAEILAVVCEADLYDIIAASDSETGSLIIRSNYVLEDCTMEYIAGTKYLPPMISKPRHISKNRDNAYLTVKESFILGGTNHHNEDVNLTNLNLANSVELSLDLSRLTHTEESSKPLDSEEKKINFERIQQGSREVYDMLLEHGNKFHNTYKYCKRGREYSQGYHVHIQSTGYKKALINLHHKEVISL